MDLRTSRLVFPTTGGVLRFPSSSYERNHCQASLGHSALRHDQRKGKEVAAPLVGGLLRPSLAKRSARCRLIKGQLGKGRLKGTCPYSNPPGVRQRGRGPRAIRGLCTFQSGVHGRLVVVNSCRLQLRRQDDDGSGLNTRTVDN